MATAIFNKFNGGFYGLAVNANHANCFPVEQYDHHTISDADYDAVKKCNKSFGEAKAIIESNLNTSLFTAEFYEQRKKLTLDKINEFKSGHKNDSNVDFMADLITFETALKALTFDGVTFPQAISFEEYLDTAISGTTFSTLQLI
jgi:hypothetical protein